MDSTLMEREEPAGMSLTTNSVQKLQRQKSVTANAVYCHRRGV